MFKKLLDKFRKQEQVPTSRNELGAYRRKKANELSKKGLTPQEIADELGVTRSTVYNYL